MNNKIIMAIIVAVIVILAAVLVIYAVSSLISDNESGLINFGGNSEPSSDISSEGSLESEEDKPSGPITGDTWGEPTIGDDDGFEGSVIPGSGNSSSGIGSESSSSSSVPSENISGSGNNSGNTGSNSGSGNTSSGPSVEDVLGDGTVTYEEYISMSGSEQQKYFESFESPEAFFAWYNDAKAKYEAENPSIEIGGDEEIDLGDIIGGNG